jgi:acetyltransferase
MLSPKVVAVIGATEVPDSVGRTLMENLLSFGENLHPVNPKRLNVLGVRAFPRIADVPVPVDLAVIATPASTVPDLVGECEEAGVPGAMRGLWHSDSQDSDCHQRQRSRSGRS